MESKGEEEVHTVFTKTKIFISSVAQDALHRTRGHVFDELVGLGHEPILFERNFGAWDSHTDPVQKCIECVRESDVFLLFIGDKAGTFNQRNQRTVTHLELIEAFSKRKTILVFIESYVKQLYFSKAEGIIEAYVEQHKRETGSFPNASDIMPVLAASELPDTVDPYVWFFIHDIVAARRIFVLELDLGVPHNWKDYFSDLLRRSVVLLSTKAMMEQNEVQLDVYDQFYETLTGCLPHLHITGFHNVHLFLTAFMGTMSGNAVVQDFGFGVLESIGEYRHCAAVTLYARKGDRLELVHKAGVASGEPYYALDDKDSYAALTYSTSTDNQVFFKEENHGTFYFCLRLPDHVMTFHFPCDPSWDADKFMASKENVINAIMKNNAMAFDLARMIIGGMPT